MVHVSSYANQYLHGDKRKGFSVIRLIGLQPSWGRERGGGGGGVQVAYRTQIGYKNV